MRRRRWFVAGGACLAGSLVAAALFAQAPAPPRPGPEVQKLGYFVGEWKFEGEGKDSSFGPGGRFSGTETCEWFAGGFQVICRSEATGPTGKTAGFSVIAYDPETREYTYYTIDSTGFSALARGTVTGETWTYTWAGTAGGKPAKLRATMQTAPAFYSGRTEGSMGGGPMTIIADVKSTRVK